MPLAEDLPIEHLTPARLWSAIDQDTRRLAAEALYDPTGSDDEAGRAQANMSIAVALRFREASVRKLALAKRVEYLARVVRPSDTLAGSLLTALHLGHRADLLGAFLDALGIPQKDGVIEADHRLEPPDAARLAPAVAALRGRFPDEHIDLYLATLLAIDPETWGALTDTWRPAGSRPGA